MATVGAASMSASVGAVVPAVWFSQMLPLSLAANARPPVRPGWTATAVI